MTRRSFAARRETFGLDTNAPWALDALRLLFNAPRVYAPLAETWEVLHPGTRRALERLVALGFVAYQGPVVIDTRTGLVADRAERPVPRYRTTGKGHRLVGAIREDSRVMQDVFPRIAGENVAKVQHLLEAFDLADSHARFGLSVRHGAELSGLKDGTSKWWVRKLVDAGLLRVLPEPLADVREVIPEHWRVTRALCAQLRDIVAEFDTAPTSLIAELRLRRGRFLSDIDPARVGISGATDFDHDVECQRLLARVLMSPRYAPDGGLAVEPRLALTLGASRRPWTFSAVGEQTLAYQPDARFREQDSDGVRLCVFEYERYQTRRDAWNHIERFLGFLALATLPFEAAVLRFVVDSNARERGYVQLIEAFCDYAMDHPQRLPGNVVQLAVSSAPRLKAAKDPLDPRAWFRIAVPQARSDTERTPVLHPAEKSPYDEYFVRS